MTLNPAAGILNQSVKIKTLDATNTHNLYSKIMKILFFKFLVMFFYYVGDIACKFEWDFMFELYQKSMKLSYMCDEKIGFWWWTTPNN
jgi:hypothetical protein